MTDYPGRRYHCYTDGSGTSQGCPGGYAAVVIDIKGTDSDVTEYVGFVPATTSQRMEMAGVIHALLRIPEGQSVTIFSDSAYVVNGMNEGWFRAWKMKKWKTSTGKTPKNLDLWRSIVAAVDRHRLVQWQHIPGHQAGDSPHAIGNRRADWLAGQARRLGIEKSLFAARHWVREPYPLPVRPAGDSGTASRRKTKSERS